MATDEKTFEVTNDTPCGLRVQGSIWRKAVLFVLGRLLLPSNSINVPVVLMNWTTWEIIFSISLLTYQYQDQYASGIEGQGISIGTKCHFLEFSVHFQRSPKFDALVYKDRIYYFPSQGSTVSSSSLVLAWDLEFQIFVIRSFVVSRLSQKSRPSRINIGRRKWLSFLSHMKRTPRLLLLALCKNSLIVVTTIKYGRPQYLLT
jgi:hypothetical protein